MKRKSVKRSKTKPSSEAGGRPRKRSKDSLVEEDQESENIPPCPTPSQNKSVIDDIRTALASQTPSRLNITAAADHGSPVSAPTISQTSVKGNLTINQTLTVVLPNTSENKHLSEHYLSVKDGEHQSLSHKTEGILQNSKSPQMHHRRCLIFGDDVEQPTLTLAEVKKNTNYLREITVKGKILERRPAISILHSEEGMSLSHYGLYDNTATVHLTLADKFTVNLDQWYIFKSVSVCDFGDGNVLCSTELTTLQPFTPSADVVQERKETVISGEVTEALVTFQYFCSCGATISLSDTKLFHVKCGECNKSCRCANIQNSAKADITIKQPCGADQKLVLTDALLHSVVSFKNEGYCDSHQLEEKLLRAKTVTVVCVDGEPQRVQMQTAHKAKNRLKNILSGWKDACLLT